MLYGLLKDIQTIDVRMNAKNDIVILIVMIVTKYNIGVVVGVLMGRMFMNFIDLIRLIVLIYNAMVVEQDTIKVLKNCLYMV